MADLEQIPAVRTRRRKIIVWTLVAVLLLVALIITPPLLNVNRLKKRIATSMSESMGRPVHLDNVILNVLPVPGFTLERVVVSEDPSFGSEPVIRADSVQATVRVSSLWRRQVEFATIRFDAPSVNLVRRSDGRWNFESILIHAAQEDTAPTAQTKAGPAPRFPYIEATGARLNVKLGDEKMPLAFSEADVALWLPSPQQWKIRLEAKPARTDTSVSDTGVVSVEATLQRASRVEDVPIELTAAWRRAPLGEATKVLLGTDAGWRGGVDATANLHGTLGDAVLNGNLKLSNLRRADFIPEKMLDLNVECAGHFAVAVAVLREPMCTLSPTPISHIGFGAVAAAPESAVYATADKVELTGLKATGVRVGTPRVSLGWVMDFARLWSQRTPKSVMPQGTASGSFVREGDRWQGELRGTIKVRSLDATGEMVDRPFTILSDADGLALAPFNLTFAEKTALLFSGSASPSNVVVKVAGTGTPHQVSFLSWAMPPLADGLKGVVPVGGVAPVKVDVTCTRVWGTEQVCEAARVAEPVKIRGRRR